MSCPFPANSTPTLPLGQKRPVTAKSVCEITWKSEWKAKCVWCAVNQIRQGQKVRRLCFAIYACVHEPKRQIGISRVVRRAHLHASHATKRTCVVCATLAAKSKIALCECERKGAIKWCVKVMQTKNLVGRDTLDGPRRQRSFISHTYVMQTRSRTKTQRERIWSGNMSGWKKCSVDWFLLLLS